MKFQARWMSWLLAAGIQSASAGTVFFTDFESALPAAIDPGTAVLTGVQGYAGLGPVGNQFGGNILRSATGNTVVLTLNGLPSHTLLSIGFLFAAIDSLDGTGTFPSGDFFDVAIDGNLIFHESFANAEASQVQATCRRRVWNSRAWWISASADPVVTTRTALITWRRIPSSAISRIPHLR